jgi:hypothetical protein
MHSHVAAKNKEGHQQYSMNGRKCDSAQARCSDALARSHTLAVGPRALSRLEREDGQVQRMAAAMGRGVGHGDVSRSGGLSVGELQLFSSSFCRGKTVRECAGELRENGAHQQLLANPSFPDKSGASSSTQHAAESMMTMATTLTTTTNMSISSKLWRRLELKMMSYGKAIEHDYGQVGAIERAVEGKEEARRAHVRDERGAEHGEDAERRPMAATSHQ